MGHNWIEVAQDYIIGPLFFLIYINSFSNDLASFPILFTDDTSLFSVVKYMIKSANNLNNGLAKLSISPFQWKMNFNSDSTKYTQEVIFSLKLQTNNNPCLVFNHNTANLSKSQKHLEIAGEPRFFRNFRIYCLENH